MTKAVQFNRIISDAVDRSAGVIRGVSVITQGPALGHGMEIDETTLAQVVACAANYKGGVRVNIDHGSGLKNAAGYLRELRVDGDRVRGDLHILESETERNRIFEMAETIPDTFGLSIAFSGEHEIKPDGVIYARCHEIYSADLVPEPAANPTGLFEKPKEDEMTKEEILEVVNGAIEEKYSALASRLTALEEKPDPEEMGSEELKAELTAKIDELKTELEAAKTDAEKRVELTARAVAKEFASNLRTNGGPAAAPPAPVEPTVQFEDKVVELRAGGKTKPEAISLAIRNHPDLHRDYLGRLRGGKTKSLEPVPA